MNIFDPELKLVNAKPKIKNKLKELLNDLKKFRVKRILVLVYRKRNHCKIFHSSAKRIDSDSNIDEASNPCIKALLRKGRNIFVKIGLSWT